MATIQTTPEVDSPRVNVMPPAVFLLCLIAGVTAGFAWPWPLPFLSQPFALIAGSVAALLGLLFMLWANAKFTSLGVNVKTNLPASMLVTRGAYQFSRNPMYVGFMALLVGIGLAANSVPMLLAAIPMFVYLEWYVIRREEQYLTRAFGEEYRAYRRKVRRWL